jgi:hypothetical protein
MELQHISDTLKILKCFNFTTKQVRYIKQGSTNFQKSSRHFQILVARKVTWSNFHAEDPQLRSVL